MCVLHACMNTRLRLEQIQDRRRQLGSATRSCSCRTKTWRPISTCSPCRCSRLPVRGHWHTQLGLMVGATSPAYVLYTYPATRAAAFQSNRVCVFLLCMQVRACSNRDVQRPRPRREVPAAGAAPQAASRGRMTAAAAARFLLVPAFYLAARPGGGQGYTILLTAVLGLSNGYLTVCVLTEAPRGYKASRSACFVRRSCRCFVRSPFFQLFRCRDRSRTRWGTCSSPASSPAYPPASRSTGCGSSARAGET